MREKGRCDVCLLCDSSALPAELSSDRFSLSLAELEILLKRGRSCSIAHYEFCQRVVCIFTRTMTFYRRRRATSESVIARHCILPLTSVAFAAISLRFDSRPFLFGVFRACSHSIFTLEPPYCLLARVDKLSGRIAWKRIGERATYIINAYLALRVIIVKPLSFGWRFLENLKTQGSWKWWEILQNAGKSLKLHEIFQRKNAIASSISYYIHRNFFYLIVEKRTTSLRNISRD